MHLTVSKKIKATGWLDLCAIAVISSRYLRHKCNQMLEIRRIKLYGTFNTRTAAVMLFNLLT